MAIPLVSFLVDDLRAAAEETRSLGMLQLDDRDQPRAVLQDEVP